MPKLKKPWESEQAQQFKAIETEWHGCRFRSRLEARWAVLFELLGIEWEYEPDGFIIDGGIRYLPDFLLRGVRVRRGNSTPIDLYVEVKGFMSDADYKKVDGFSRYKPIYVVTKLPYEKGKSWHEVCEERCYDWPYPFNFKTVDGDNFGAFLGVNESGEPVLFGDDSTYLNDASTELTDLAYRTAALVRFEHNERPEDHILYRDTLKSIRLLKADRWTDLRAECGRRDKYPMPWDSDASAPIPVPRPVPKPRKKVL